MLYGTLKLWLRPLQNRGLSTSASSSLQRILLLSDGSIETFREQALNVSRPAQFPNGLWPFGAARNWITQEDSLPAFNLAYFEPFSHHIVPTEVSEVDQVGDVLSFERIELPLGVFMGQTMSTSLDFPRKHLYIAQAPVRDLPQVLQADLPTPSMVEKAGRGDLYDTSIWLGANASNTPLHRDPTHNLFVQLAGRKSIRLLDPHTGKLVYEGIQQMIGKSGHSKFRGEEMMVGPERKVLDQLVWDESKLPGPICSKLWKADLSAGDAIFIPKGWWHAVRGISEGVTASANWWFD